MSTIKLSPAQHAILAYAHQHAEGKIVWFPDNIKGGARKKVLDGLYSRGLIASAGADWFVSAEGYNALGVPHEAPITAQAIDAVVEHAQPRTRENTKQAQVIAMLKRPEGATLSQICDATNWQPHTVRGTFAGTFKKKLGLTITSDKSDGGERVYRIGVVTTP